MRTVPVDTVQFRDVRGVLMVLLYARHVEVWGHVVPVEAEQRFEVLPLGVEEPN
jgi:hypothetical protein